tara:strand:- start:1119 stop:1346 length:228 start_codon:yes stop_codon:yes gene_type:complete
MFFLLLVEKIFPESHDFQKKQRLQSWVKNIYKIVGVTVDINEQESKCTITGMPFSVEGIKKYIIKIIDKTGKERI